jgi:predicted MFS family arabinose efflux permease
MVFYGVLAALGFAGTSIPLFAALASRWFQRHKGAAIGLALAGSCLGQYVLVPMSTRLMLHWGWRPAFMIIGAMVLVVNLSLAWKVIKDRPEAMGLQPYGAGGEAPKAHKGRVQAIEPHIGSDFNLGQALATRSFWLFLIIMVICGGGDNFILTHLIPMVTDYGISSTRAGHMLAWSGLLSLAGVLLAGPVADRIGNKAPIIITFLLRAIVFALVLQYQNMVSFYVLALVFGFTMLITAPLCVTLLGRLYGFAHIGLLSGFITTLHHLGGGLWVYGGGVIFDQTGSYHLALALAALFSLIAVLCAVFIKEKRHTMKQY